MPGFFVNRTAQCVALLDEVGEPNAFVQYDAYHAQRMEGELAGTLARYLPRIAHVQVADNPGRHEPGTGEIRFEFLFAELERLGYDGWIGCEYRPAGRTRTAWAGCRRGRWRRAAGSRRVLPAVSSRQRREARMATLAGAAAAQAGRHPANPAPRRSRP